MLQYIHHAEKSKLGGAADVEKHTFSAEDPAQRNAVKPAAESAVLPRLKTVRESLPVELPVGGNQFPGDPGAVLSGPLGRGAGTDHIIKSSIDPQFKSPVIFFQFPLDAVGDMQIHHRQDAPGIRETPKHISLFAGPGKKSVPVCSPEHIGIQIGRDRHDPFIIFRHSI